MTNAAYRYTIIIITLLVLGVIGLAVSPQPVQAATIQVTTDIDPVAGPTNGDGCTLREAVTNANNNAVTHPDCTTGAAGLDNITFAGGVNTITLSNTVPTGFISINEDLTIDGPITIDGGGVTSIFRIGGGATVTLNSTTIQNAIDSAILINAGNLAANVCNFNNNASAGSGGGAINAAGTSNDVDIDVCTFDTNSSATGDGGAIRKITNGTLNITASYFVDNTAGGKGGAIDANGPGTITATAFQDNEADGASNNDGGGAIYFEPNALFTITASAFSGNLATGTDGRGGAIFHSGNTAPAALNINFSHFGSTPIPLPAPFDQLTDPNEAQGSGGIGGAIYTRVGTAILGSSFIGNISGGDGGAIGSSTRQASNSFIANSTFSNNTATGSGGAIYQFAETGVTRDIDLINVTIADNTAAAGSGGGVFIDEFGGGAAELGVSNTILANNVGDNCAQTAGTVMTDSGNNLVFSSPCPGITPVTTGDPQLGMAELTISIPTILTYTRPLGTGSAAHGAGDSTICTNFPIVNLDQRGFPRPAGGPNCDIGAYESDLTPAEIDVQGNAISIADGDNTPDPADDTDFGITLVGTPVTNTFTILNNGDSDLTIGMITVPVGFTVTTPPVSPVAGMGMTTFDLRCDAGSANTFAGTVSIVNNDSDENPYDFDVTCQVDPLVPEIDVQGNAISIANGDNTPDPADDTDFGITTVGTPVTNTFTIENLGTGDLTLGAITVPAGFTVTGPPVTPVTAGNTTTFDVRCDAGSANTFAGTVSIVNNDSDENPYDFDVTCQVDPLVPEIDVQGNAISIANGDNTPDPADDTDFGITTVGTPVTNTFTIENLGTGDLTLGAITVPAGFTVTGPPVTPVTAGNMTTFDVRCDAGSAATFSGTVSIVNDDADENPYTFDITCQVDATAPEIDVQGNAISIVNGDPSPSAGDHTAFGSTVVATPISRTYTIENLGTSDLTLGVVTAPAGFTVTTQPTSPVAPAGTTTFIVQCDAGSAATFSGTVSIPNNDSDENPYTFAITCDVTATPAPEIDVQGNGISIVDGDNTPSVLDDTDFGVTTVGTPTTRTYTIENLGTANLTITLVTPPAGFFLGGVPAMTVVPAGTTTFVIDCPAVAPGTFTGTVSIDNDDSNENPYTFDITCQVDPLLPEIDVQGNGMSIADGDNTPSVLDDTDFGATTVGTPVTRTYTIENQGTGNLTINAVNLPGGFFLGGAPAMTVVPAGTTTFTVDCLAAAPGTFTGTVSIDNDDSDENPYTFDITCQVNPPAAPEINVLGNGITIVDGDVTPSLADDTDFGSTSVGNPISRTYTIENQGTLDLTIGVVAVPAGFSVTGVPGTPVTAGNTTTLTVQCDAGSAATFSGTVSIPNNDSDENPYNFDITCNVTAAPEPEIDIQGNGITIVDGDVTPSLVDDTDFGTTTLGTAISRTFTIANAGTADLTIGVVTVPAGFSVTGVPGTPVTAGNTTTLTVQCDAAVVNTYSGTVSIPNNDSDEDPYTFDIICDVIPVPPIPVITATKDDALLIDVDMDGQADPGDTLQYTVVITNSGGADATAVVFDDVPDGDTTLIAGSVTTTQGTVTTGNTGGDTTVSVDVGTLVMGGGSVTITFEVVVDNPLPGGVTQIANQGTVSGGNFANTPTDDPATGAVNDATVTPIDQPGGGGGQGGGTGTGGTAAAGPPCSFFDGTVSAIVRADVPGGTVTDGSVFCRVINENGVYVTSPAEVGNQTLIDYQVVQAVDIFGMTANGVPVVPFNNSIAVCLRGQGFFNFLDATTSNRTVLHLLETTQTIDGQIFTCADIPNSGTVVLTMNSGGAAQQSAVPVPPTPGTAASNTSVPLSGCRVTTNFISNLRDAPSLDSNIIRPIPFDTTYDATERTSEWFRIIVDNGQGWVSAGLVSTSGPCGG